MSKIYSTIPFIKVSAGDCLKIVFWRLRESGIIVFLKVLRGMRRRQMTHACTTTHTLFLSLFFLCLLILFNYLRHCANPTRILQSVQTPSAAEFHFSTRRGMRNPFASIPSKNRLTRARDLKSISNSTNREFTLKGGVPYRGGWNVAGAGILFAPEKSSASNYWCEKSNFPSLIYVLLFATYAFGSRLYWGRIAILRMHHTSAMRLTLHRTRQDRIASNI